MEPIIYKQFRFTWHYYVVTVIALLIFGSLLKGESEIFALILVGIGFMLGMWATNNNLGKQIVLSKEGITDDKGLFRSWKSIDHCYFTAGKRRFLTLVYKNKEELSDTISFDNYPVRKTDLERAINQMAGKSLVQYTFEDKCAEKETDREINKVLFKSLFIALVILLLAILFSTLFATKSVLGG